jgi:hypothetical protein
MTELHAIPVIHRTAAIRAATLKLLFLLGVKRGFLRLQIGDQFSGPINRDLIAYREQYSSIPFNRFVDLDALVTHCSSAFARAADMTPKRPVCSSNELGHL